MPIIIGITAAMVNPNGINFAANKKLKAVVIMIGIAYGNWVWTWSIIGVLVLVEDIMVVSAIGDI